MATSPLTWPSELFNTFLFYTGSDNQFWDLDLEFRRSGAVTAFYRQMKVGATITRLWVTLETSGQENRDGVSSIFKMNGGFLNSVIGKES